ncbi:MAG TPA: hypothetical protein VL294_00105 [Pseudolysinimonas sp.]|jgi:hypothetical protein|nr:hypothetical protein [Pseudolysinimonas sp.]
MVKVITLVLRLPRSRHPRHRLAAYRIEQRTHPWFEQRAQRIAELGQYR